MTTGSSKSICPCRGDVWRVNLDPTVGAEIKKTRPAIVISTDAIGRLPIKLIVPVTTWKDTFQDKLWLVRLEPNESNGLTNISAADTLQIRGIDIDRFIEKLGIIPSEILNEISAAVAAIVEY